MTPEELATLHRAAFRMERPWSAAEFTDLLESPYTELFTHDAGFALARTLAGESELLTLAVVPTQQRQGAGRTLTQAWLSSLEGRAETAFLEVASDNTAARTLYASLDFETIATRPAYYARKNAAAADAIVMKRAVTFGQSPVSQG